MSILTYPQKAAIGARVLENDTLDGDPAGENGAPAELLIDVSHETLALSFATSTTHHRSVSFTTASQERGRLHPVRVPGARRKGRAEEASSSHLASVYAHTMRDLDVRWKGK